MAQLLLSIFLPVYVDGLLEDLKEHEGVEGHQPLDGLIDQERLLPPAGGGRGEGEGRVSSRGSGTWEGRDSACREIGMNLQRKSASPSFLSFVPPCIHDRPY